MADNTQASASHPVEDDMPSESTDEQQQQPQPTLPSTPTRTEDDEVDAPSQTNNDNVAKQQTTNTATAVNAFEQRLMEKALSKKNVANNNEEESSTSILQQENMSTTDESSSNIHGLEVVPDDKDLPRPSSDFDDSIEKKQKKKIANNNIIGGGFGINNDDDGEGPPLPPRITFDDSLEEKRRKVGIMQEEYDDAINNTQACAASSTDDEWMSDMSEKIQRNIQARNTIQENSRRDTEQHEQDDDDGAVGTLSLEETQRRSGDSKNNDVFDDVEVGREQDENIIASTTRRRRRSVIRGIANSLFPQIYGSDVLVEATLVESNASVVVGEVVEAERVGYCARRWKSIAIFLVSLLVLFAILLSVSLALGVFTTADEELITDVPSMQPSSSPTWDTRPTFDIVRERGYVLCGISNFSNSLSQGSIVDLVSFMSALTSTFDNFMCYGPI